jgi:peptidoglycan hydrolase-like protein with peptidoglycan-binding domain
MQGPSIRQVQEKLNELGANPRLATDGAFDWLTEETVISFQQANRLTDDGIVGSLTWNTLFSRQPLPQPPPTTVWPPYPGVDLRRGMQGPSIRQVQERLNELGANPRLTADGVFGAVTETMVILFQRANDLTPNGIVDTVTWNVLFSRKPAPLPSIWPPYPGINLRRGMQGPSVRQVQERLNELGVNPHITADGAFDWLTEETVIVFQQANRLTTDGIVDTLTWSVLFSHQPSPQSPPPTIWPPYPGVDLRRGMQGPSIRQVQERLNELGANPLLTADGTFDELTKDIVTIFQRANNLTPTGIVDTDTWNVLFSRKPIPPRKRMIALTFDDGPRHLTNRLLDILERYETRATFFFLGYIIEAGRDIVARAANLGNEIAVHAWEHHNLMLLSDEEIAESIKSTGAAIESIVGFSPPIFRPPFGAINDNVRNVAGKLGYSMVLWTLDTMDWHHLDADIIYDIIMDNVSDGENILLHEIHRTTVDAMERVIPSLIAEGFELVTVSELLAHKHGILEPGRVYR